MSLQLVDILGRNHSPAASAFAVNDQNDAVEQAAIKNYGMIAGLGRAGQEPRHKLRVRIVNVRIDQPDCLSVGIMIAPNIDVIQPRPAENHRITCSREPGPSRHERRRQHQSLHVVPPRNLGVIEGERLRSARGYHEDYGLAKALASLVAVAAILFCAAVIVGAV